MPELGVKTSFVRRGILVVLLLGTLGMSAELLLLVHYEEIDQLIPLALAALALAVLAWGTLAPSAAAFVALRAVMTAFMLAGVAGIVLHFQATAEFQREVDPALDGFELAWKVLQAKAPPALAPGVMVQLGLLGWLYAYLGANEDREAARETTIRSTRT